jgi:ketosteroid isomerase-like protein
VAGLALLVAALGTSAALFGLPGGSSGTSRARAPLSTDEVRDVAQDFAQAYEAEDGKALGRLLTRDVQRVLPNGVARGRTRVVKEYQSQFRAQKTQHYSLDDLEVQAGKAGRASGSYRVEREGGQPIEGRIVLGMVRDRGEPRIGLIAVTPRS